MSLGQVNHVFVDFVLDQGGTCRAAAPAYIALLDDRDLVPVTRKLIGDKRPMMPPPTMATSQTIQTGAWGMLHQPFFTARRVATFQVHRMAFTWGRGDSPTKKMPARPDEPGACLWFSDCLRASPATRQFGSRFSWIWILYSMLLSWFRGAPGPLAMWASAKRGSFQSSRCLQKRCPAR